VLSRPHQSTRHEPPLVLLREGPRLSVVCSYGKGATSRPDRLDISPIASGQLETARPSWPTRGHLAPYLQSSAASALSASPPEAGRRPTRRWAGAAQSSAECLLATAQARAPDDADAADARRPVPGATQGQRINLPSHVWFAWARSYRSALGWIGCITCICAVSLCSPVCPF
jgi:hypothetical protein